MGFHHSVAAIHRYANQHQALHPNATAGQSSDNVPPPQTASQVQMMSDQNAAERLNLMLALFLAILLCGFAPRTAAWLNSGSFTRGWWFTSRSHRDRDRHPASKRKVAVPTSSLSCKYVAIFFFYNAGTTSSDYNITCSLRWLYNK